MLIGDILEKRFELREVLGEGGMGQVFKAWDRDLERFVAIKTLLPQFLSDPSALSEMKREVRLSQSLSHPNIVAVYDYRVHNRTPFIVMEFVEGQPLNHHLHEQPQHRLSETAFRSFAEQILSGIEYAHKTGVVHRDLKPANLMVLPDGRLKIMDFGIAAAIKATYTRLTGHSSGLTIQYSSPEQINGEDPSPSMDIYSLSCVFYEMLSGHPPFYQGEILHQQLNRRPDPISGLSSALNHALQASLAKQAEERPRSASEFRALLSGNRTVRLQPPYSAEGELIAQPDRSIIRASAGLDRRDFRRLATLYGLKTLIPLTAVLAIGGSAWWWQLSQRSREQKVLDLRGSIVQTIDRGNWVEAEKDVTSLLSLTPQDPSALHWLKQIQNGKKNSRITDLRKVIFAAIAEGRWTEAAWETEEFDRLSPGTNEVVEWRSEIQQDPAKEKEIDALRGSAASSIQARDWTAAERDVSRLVSLAPRDNQALEWQKLLHQGRLQELLAAERLKREQRVTGLREAALNAVSTRDWETAERSLADLAALVPNDSQIAELRSQVKEGRDAGLRAAQEAIERERAEVARRDAARAAAEAEKQKAAEMAAREAEAKATEERAAREAAARRAEQGSTFASVHMHRSGSCYGNLTVSSTGITFSGAKHSISLQKTDVNSVSECKAHYFSTNPSPDWYWEKCVCLKTTSGNFNFSGNNPKILEAIRSYWGR